MNERINDKLEEIEEFLSILLDIIPNSFEEYKSNYEKKWSCEKGFQNIIEAITDVSFLMINEKRFNEPKDDLNAFEILSKKGLIPEVLYKKFKEAKGMRNILAHEYGKIDDEIVFNAIKSELEKDANEFVSAIRSALREEVE